MASNSTHPAAAADGGDLPIEQQTTENRRNARARHLLRHRQELAVSAVTVAFAALTYPVQQYLMRTNFDALLWLDGIVVAVAFAILVLHWTIDKKDRETDWNLAVSNAQATMSPEATARGYTQLFGQYVEAKRRAGQLRGVAAFLAAHAIAGGIAYSVSPPSDAVAAVLRAAFAAELGASLIIALFLIRQARALSSSYLAGDVLIRHTLALALHATSNITDLHEAKRQVEQDTRTLMREFPWWFYKD